MTKPAFCSCFFFFFPLMEGLLLLQSPVFLLCLSRPLFPPQSFLLTLLSALVPNFEPFFPSGPPSHRLPFPLRFPRDSSSSFRQRCCLCWISVLLLLTQGLHATDRFPVGRILSCLRPQGFFRTSFSFGFIFSFFARRLIFFGFFQFSRRVLRFSR